MEFDSVCDTKLVLGLALNSSPSMVKLNKKRCVMSGGCSSISSMTVKREREVGSEESEKVSNGNNYSRVMSDGDGDGCVNGRKKLRLTKPQYVALEDAFKLHNSLNLKQKQELARELKLRPRQVEVWFQNRRARTKLKQVEMDLEHLKKFCDKLTCENRRLEKEVQDLKALTICPSCERISKSSS